MVAVGDLVEVHPPSASAVDLSRVTVRVTGDPGPCPPSPAVDDHLIGGSVSLQMSSGETETYDLVRWAE